VDLQSEEAFEIAQSGAIRPKVLGTPIVYDIQLVHFEPPSFQLKIACASENDTFLRALIQELGVMLDTTARPTRLQRVQFGPFLRSHALLDKYFQLPTIIKNIAMCNKIIETQLASANDRNVRYSFSIHLKLYF
jgi:tRNA U55 pseudouridine synthase TruB